MCGGNVGLGQYRKRSNFVQLCPNGNVNEVSMQFNIGPYGPYGALICLKALTVRKHVFIHE